MNLVLRKGENVREASDENNRSAKTMFEYGLDIINKLEVITNSIKSLYLGIKNYKI